MKKLQYVVCGGTFDYLHKGHREFLKYQFSISQNVCIGITSDELGTLKTPNCLSFVIRKRDLTEFLKKENYFQRAQIAKINNPYIPKAFETFPIEAIVVTNDTKKGAELINKKRVSDGLKKLPVFVYPMQKAENGGSISSSRIREGEIDRDGKLFIKPQWLFQTLILPDTLRDEFAKPFGTLFTNFDQWFTHAKPDPKQTISVGDIVTKKLNEKKFNQKISVVDFKTHRQKTFTSLSDLGFFSPQRVSKVKNPAGQITGKLFQAIITMFENKKSETYVLLVNGEEDLAVLGFILAAPLGFTILYGQPDKGIVWVRVVEESKKYARDLAEQFIIQK